VGILSRIDERRILSESSTDDKWRTVDGWVLTNPLSTAGIRVDAKTAMAVAACYACVRVLAETVAYLPLQMFEWKTNGDRDIARNHPLYDILHWQPNSSQTSFEWREMMMGHLVLRQNAYSRIVPGPRGAVDQLIPLHPDRMVPEQRDNYRMVYHYTHKDGRKETFVQEEILHLRGLSDDGISGMSTLNLAKDVLGTAYATEQYGASMFRNGAQLGGIIRKKGGGVLTPEAKQNITEGFRKFHGSGNAFKTMVLEEDMEWTQIGMRARDAEFLASRQFSVNEVCRIFRVPPHLVQDLERATFSNIEHQSISFVVYTLGPWLARWEQAIRRDLILAKNRFFAEFNVDGLLRGDIVSRYTAYGTGIEKGFLTRQEARRRENMNAIDGLDTPLRPLNMGNGATAPSEEQAQPAGPSQRSNSEDARATQFVRAAAERLANKEITAVRKALAKHTGDELTEWLDAFYSGYGTDIQRGLLIPYEVAQDFALSARKTLQSANGSGSGPFATIDYAIGKVDEWEKTRAAALTELGLMKGEVDALQ
jgi:HK97 family phage portal protein